MSRPVAAPTLLRRASVDREAPQTNTAPPEPASDGASTSAQTNTAAPVAARDATSRAPRTPVPLANILLELEVAFAARDLFGDGKPVLASGHLLRTDGVVTAAPACEFCDEILCSCAASQELPDEYSQMRLDFLNALIEDAFARGIASFTRDPSGRDALVLASFDDRSSFEIILNTSYERGIAFAAKKAADDKKQRRILKRGVTGRSPASISTETRTSTP